VAGFCAGAGITTGFCTSVGTTGVCSATISCTRLTETTGFMVSTDTGKLSENISAVT